MYTHLEDYIHGLYKSINVANPVDLDMLQVARKLGVHIVYERRRVFCLEDEINLVRGTKRQEWMDFGHEVCHYLRHSGSQLNMSPLFIELQEWQANNFMYHFCVPTFMIENMDLPDDRKQAARIIYNSFNVSLAFAERRIDKWISQREGALIYRMATNKLAK